MAQGSRHCPDAAEAHNVVMEDEAKAQQQVAAHLDRTTPPLMGWPRSAAILGASGWSDDRKGNLHELTHLAR
ncbi:MAG: hypothetical protein JO283_22290 [Bradyrhizobium sp.]|nr:hypothetical protein [Bradyrhizobium sp.]